MDSQIYLGLDRTQTHENVRRYCVRYCVWIQFNLSAIQQKCQHNEVTNGVQTWGWNTPSEYCSRLINRTAVCTSCKPQTYRHPHLRNLLPEYPSLLGLFIFVLTYTNLSWKRIDLLLNRTKVDAFLSLHKNQIDPQQSPHPVSCAICWISVPKHFPNRNFAFQDSQF